MDLEKYERDAKNLKKEWRDEAYDNYEKFVEPITTDNTQHNNDVDAYRHAYVSAKLTQFLADNQYMAEVILDSHEVNGDNTPYEHRMDGWNNEVGRRFGDEYASEELGKKLAEELKEGGLLATSPDDKRLEALYSNDPKIKDFNPLVDNKSTFGIGKEDIMGVSEEAMDKITDDASKEIDKLMSTRDDLTFNELDTTAKAEEVIASMGFINDNSQVNHMNNDMELV